MNFQKRLRLGIMLSCIFFGFAVAGCAKKLPFNPIIGEDIIPTTGVQTITSPERAGAWYSDRYVDQVFRECLNG